MKYLNLSKKAIVISGACFVLILCVTFYLGAASCANNAESSGYIVTYAADDSTHSPLEIETHKKEIEVANILKKFDEKNILSADVWLSLGDSDEVTDAYLVIASREKIMNMDELVSLASESLNLSSDNIHVDVDYGEGLIPLR